MSLIQAESESTEEVHLVCAVAGGTGLVGNCVLDLLAKESKIHRIIALGRRDPQKSRVEFLPWDFVAIGSLSLETNAKATLESSSQIDVGISCLGTTIRAAGSKERFYKVDHDFNVQFAKLCFTRGATKFILVSASGANAKSRIFYNQVKGQTEDSIAAIGFREVYFLRPSLLIGDRSEIRPAEQWAQNFSKALKPILGSLKQILPVLKNFQPVAAEKVAQQILALTVPTESSPKSNSLYSDQNATPLRKVISNREIGELLA